MATAVLSASNVSGPFQMASRIAANAPSLPSSASPRSKQQPSSSSTTSTSQTSESPSKPFNRFRSTLEQSIRTATRSKKQPAPVSDEFATIAQKSSKGKEKAVEESPPDKERPGMLRRLESKVNFRRPGRDSVTPSPSPVPLPSKSKESKKGEGRVKEKGRVAGPTTYVTPSLRQGSMSSPALHLYSQALPSPKSQPAIPASSSSTSEALVSPTRERYKRSHEPTSKHRPTQSQPINIPSSSAIHMTSRSPPGTPMKRGEPPSPPETPTPMSRSHGQLSRSTARPAPLVLSNSPPPSPTPRGTSPSPMRARSRVTSSSQLRGLTSASTSQLPLTPTTPTTPRRPSVDSPQRPSGEMRRPSGGAPGREESPSPVRLRPISPTQRSYAQNRHFNISTASLVASSNPEHREIIRTATSLLCKETVKPLPHMIRTDAGQRDWDEVEVRMRALARLERIWGKSGASGSATNLSNIGGLSSSGLSASGEERERRLFCEALRDGFVLCQLLNKLRSASIVKPDPKEDGFVRTANVTRFLAACSSWGLPHEDLFQRDDLIEASSESLARVAKTIIALIHFVDSPVAARSRYISGQAKRPAGTTSPPPSGPYSPGSVRAGSTSTPNLVPNRPTSPPASPVRKRYSPPSGLPPVRSDSPDETPKSERPDPEVRHASNGDREGKEIPKVMSPPPRSPLRARAPPSKLPPLPSTEDDSLFTWSMSPVSPTRSSVADSTKVSIGDVSFQDSTSVAHYDAAVRQSVASTVMSDSTTTTIMSSLLDVGRKTSSVFNKFGTIRTMNTDMTSEAPSLTRTEASAIAEDIRRKGESSKQERKLNGTSVVDLSRVIEEAEDSGSGRSRATSRGKRKKQENEVEKEVEKDKERMDKGPALRLGKGKWPDDFMDAVQSHNQSRPIPVKSPPADDRPSQLSGSPPRKLAIVGANRHNESAESLPQFPRRPSHRARHSIDAPTHLMPKDSVFRRDGSPDALPGSSRVMLRRNSSKQAQRGGVFLPRDEMRPSEGDSTVPFPRTSSGDHSPASPSRTSTPGEDHSDHLPERPRPIRGRFQSDVEGSKRKARPNSYDELGAKPARSRFESMANLGGPSANTSASDLLSMDGSAVRKTLIVREEGKLPTHFQLGNCIGRGQFGSVYRALNLNTGQMVAVKRIRLEGLKEEEVTTLMREVDLVKRLSHPSIVKYEGMARDEDTLSIVLEYAENGSLGQTLKAFGKLNERLVASYVVKILEGLHYLHKSDVVHCDLKAANILTTKNGNVKLSDFGVSLNMRAMEREIKDVAGTPNWMAPEVIELKGASPKSDIWSLACTVIELLTGRPPYGDIANSMSVMFRIVEDDMPPLPEGCSPPLDDFLRLCFNKDPSLRPSAELLCEHEWLKTNWGVHKELRPQDSIPFLRRVSADLHKSDAVRYLSQMDMPDSPATTDAHAVDETVSGTPPGRRLSTTSLRPLPENDIAPREHTFVKTTFSKPMVCRVCLLSVKKSAVLCAQCSLISHAKCAINAPPTCDLRAQLLLYAQYAEKGNPGSAYSNPLDDMGHISHPKSPVSDVAYVAHSPRTSLDTAPPAHVSPPHPPTAYTRMAAFKKGRPGPSSDAGQGASSHSLPQEPRKKAVLHRKKERPHSLSSNSTTATSSMRSANESQGKKSVVSASLAAVDESDIVTTSRITSTSVADSDVDDDSTPIPGALGDSKRHKKPKSASSCVVQ